jgi:large subunit ribosomal protein L2
LDLSKSRPPKSLIVKTIKKSAGRGSSGKITIRHRGGGHKKKLRLIDFKRKKFDISGKVQSIEYDPNRTSNIALIAYQDGDRRYILAPEKLKTGDIVVSGEKVDVKPGNTTRLEQIPVGTPIHNIELRPGKGGQIVRSAGSSATIQSKEGKYASVLLPSKEIRLINFDCMATIGQVSNPEHQNVKLGKAGSKRHRGIRPTVRGTAQHPGAHPHGGGEGRSGVGLKHPKSPWGKATLGKKTRNKRKYSNKYIVRDRRKK